MELLDRQCAHTISKTAEKHHILFSAETKSSGIPFHEIMGSNTFSYH